MSHTKLPNIRTITGLKKFLRKGGQPYNTLGWALSEVNEYSIRAALVMTWDRVMTHEADCVVNSGQIGNHIAMDYVRQFPSMLTANIILSLNGRMTDMEERNLAKIIRLYPYRAYLFERKCSYGEFKL